MVGYHPGRREGGFPCLPRPWPTRLLVDVGLWLVLLHLAEVPAWEAFFLFQGCVADAGSAFHFPTLGGF